jgi:glycosyltransferase involved in cell wall biosynthesis
MSGEPALQGLRRCTNLLWPRVPAQLRRSAFHGAVGLLRPRISAVSRDVIIEHRVPRIVVGLLSSATGLGQSARLTAAALRSQGYSVLGIDLSGFFYEGERVTHGLPDGRFHRGPGHAIVVINGPFMPYALTLVGRGFLEEKWITAYWAWELAHLPRNWTRGFPCLHEIAVPSQFVAQAIEPETANPVVVAAHPVACDPPPPSPFVIASSRPEGPFTVITVANLGSSFARKNPLALIKAYQLAFGGDRDCRLRMRLIGSEAYPKHRAKILATIGDSDTIEVEWRAGSRAQLYGWWGTPDVYAALHRSEGFGLPIAEAMLAGYPVVATGWSGNMQFMSEKNAFPVAYRLTPVDDPDGKYSDTGGACWAEPNIEHAAALLQLLRRDRDLGRAMGCKARAAVSEQLSAASFARRLVGGS